MAEALQQSSSPEIHGGQRSELVDEASNHDRNHAQILEALAAVTQLFEEGHALATKQNVDLHAENMNQRAKAARQDAELHAQLLRNNEATAAQRAELHAQQLHMNKAAAAQQAELHAQRLQINEAAAAEQAKLHAQQLQINDSAAVQLANLDQIFQKHSERAEQCFSAYAAHHDDSLAVRIWVQKESVASNTGVLSIAMCCAYAVASFSPMSRNVPGFHRWGVTVAYLAILVVARLSMQALLICTHRGRQDARCHDPLLFIQLGISILAVIDALSILTENYASDESRSTHDTGSRITSYLLPGCAAVAAVCLNLVARYTNMQLPEWMGRVIRGLSLIDIDDTVTTPGGTSGLT